MDRRRVVNRVNGGADEGLGAPLRQASVRGPLIIWPDCRGAVRALHQTDPGSGLVFHITGLLRLQHTYRIKIDSALVCIFPLADFIPDLGIL